METRGKEIGRGDHFDALAKSLREAIRAMPDTRLEALYWQLRNAGWGEVSPDPENTEQQFKNLMIEAVLREWNGREKRGVVPSVP